MIIEQELREQMQRALSGQVSLNELYAWLMDRSWNMHKDSEPPAVELAAEVEALFFERSDGLLRDAELERRLQALLNNVVVSRAVEVTAKQQQYFAYLKMASLMPSAHQASGLVAA